MREDKFCRLVPLAYLEVFSPNQPAIRGILLGPGDELVGVGDAAGSAYVVIHQAMRHHLKMDAAKIATMSYTRADLCLLRRGGEVRAAWKLLGVVSDKEGGVDPIAVYYMNPPILETA